MNLKIIKIRLKNIFRRKFLFSKLFFDKFFFELKKPRLLPNSGDLVIVKYYVRYTGKHISFFKYNLFFGICISKRYNLMNSLFILRNSYKRTAFEFKFFLYSPLIKSLKFISNKRRFYTKSSIFFLRNKKISFSKIGL